jgi:hypothetical protein
MRFRLLPIGLAVLGWGWLGGPSEAQAGMPVVTVSEIARMRLEAISFFLVCFLVAARVGQRIWNGLRPDLPRLPHLSYGKAVGLAVLWGLLFLLVLTMISGARELMTPGAWRKAGFTYALREDRPQPVVAIDDNEAARRGRLDQLRMLLWNYARHHEGSFPAGVDDPEIPAELWTLPDPSGMRYVYVGGGEKIDQGEIPLVYEPGIFGVERLVLLTSGTIRGMTIEEIRRSLTSGEP